MDAGYNDQNHPDDPRSGRFGQQVPPYDRQTPSFYQQQPPPYAQNYPPYQQPPVNQRLFSHGSRGSSWDDGSKPNPVGDIPPPTEEDQKLVGQIRRNMFYTNTLPAMSGTWLSIYLMNRYVLPLYGLKFRLGAIPSLAISFATYGYCVYRSGKECIKGVANRSTSPYGDAVREILRAKYPQIQFTAPIASGFAPTEDSPYAQGGSYYPRQLQPAPAPQAYGDRFSQPISSRLRRKGTSESEFSEDLPLDTGSEFSPDEKFAHDTGFRTPRTLRDDPDETKVTPKVTTSYDELRMRNRAGLKL